jgi:hypothetical protein
MNHPCKFNGYCNYIVLEKMEALLLYLSLQKQEFLVTPLSVKHFHATSITSMICFFFRIFHVSQS